MCVKIFLVPGRTEDLVSSIDTLTLKLVILELPLSNVMHFKNNGLKV